MIKRKRKGFTIVELVIVIAVIAVLAAVLIPTFASIIARANQSADIQAVRQMNMALATESAIKAPKGIEDVIQILADAGYNAKDKLIPVSKNHGFYWCSEVNLIALIKDEDVDTPELIFPLDNEALKNAVTTAAGDWTAATTGDDAAFFDLGEKAEDILSAGGGITSAADLKAALETGGTVQLADHITIDTETEAIEIPEGKQVTIDLNGKTLTIEDPSNCDEVYGVISVLGELTITGGDIIISAENTYAGIYIGVPDEGLTGTLTLENVNITGSMEYSIENLNTLSLKNSTFTVNYGYGLSNAGTATIENCSFVANGEGVAPVYSWYGNMEITGTKFTEDGNFMSYAEAAPIKVSDGTATLEDVDVTTGADKYSVFAGSSSTVVVKSGTYNTKFLCNGDTTTVTIYGGTFYDGTSSVVYDNLSTDSAIFDGLDFKLTEGKDCWVISKPQT